MFIVSNPVDLPAALSTLQDYFVMLLIYMWHNYYVGNFQRSLTPWRHQNGSFVAPQQLPHGPSQELNVLCDARGLALFR